MNELIITMPTLAKRRIDLGEAEEAVIVEDTIIRTPSNLHFIEANTQEVDFHILLSLWVSLSFQAWRPPGQECALSPGFPEWTVASYGYSGLEQIFLSPVLPMAHPGPATTPTMAWEKEARDQCMPFRPCFPDGTQGKWGRLQQQGSWACGRAVFQNISLSYCHQQPCHISLNVFMQNQAVSVLKSVGIKM